MRQHLLQETEEEEVGEEEAGAGSVRGADGADLPIEADFDMYSASFDLLPIMEQQSAEQQQHQKEEEDQAVGAAGCFCQS